MIKMEENMASMGWDCLVSLGRGCTQEQRMLVDKKGADILRQIRERAKDLEKEINGHKDVDKMMEAVRKSIKIVKEVVSSNIPGTEEWQRTASKKLAAVEIKWERFFELLEVSLLKMEVQRLKGEAKREAAIVNMIGSVLGKLQKKYHSLQRQNQSLEEQNQRLREENARERARNAEVPIAAETPFAVEVPFAQVVQEGPGEDQQRGSMDAYRVPMAQPSFTTRPPQGQGPRPGQGRSGNNRMSGRRQGL